MQRACVLVLSSVLVACGGGDSPEAEVRKVLAAMEQAAEARDASDLTEHLSQEYRDAYGQGPTDAARYARGYFLAHQSIHLLTRIEQVEFPSPDEARATVLVGMAGRETDADDAWDLAADLHEFDVALAREDGEWKVTYAEWRRR